MNVSKTKEIANSAQTRDEDLHNLTMIFGGHIYFQTLYAAIKLDLFSMLADKGPMSQEEIAEALSIESKPARILLLGLSSIRLLKKDGDQYSNMAISDELLCKKSPRNLNKIIEWEHEIVYQGMFYFYESIKANKNLGLEVFKGNEKTLYERLAHVEEKNQIFQDAMHQISVHANADLVQHVDFSNIGYLVDVGGGDGTNLMQIADSFPHIRGAVFDLSSVCPITEKNLKDKGYSNRIEAISGDCFQDAFPEGADCFLFSHFMTIWSEEKDRTLFQKAYDALDDGGKVMIFNQMQDNDRQGPLFASIGSPYFLTIATGEGMLYTWQEYEDWMKDAGFQDIQSYELPRNHGVIIGTK